MYHALAATCNATKPRMTKYIRRKLLVVYTRILVPDRIKGLHAIIHGYSVK